MHDRNGTPLKIGDIVNVPCVIQNVCATEEYCNLGLETVFGRRPDDMKEHFSAVNTGQVVLASRPAARESAHGEDQHVRYPPPAISSAIRRAGGALSIRSTVTG